MAVIHGRGHFDLEAGILHRKSAKAAEDVPIFDAAGYLGMSPTTLQEVYGHHRTDFQDRAAGYATPPKAGGGLMPPPKNKTAPTTIRQLNPMNRSGTQVYGAVQKSPILLGFAGGSVSSGVSGRE